MSTAFEVEMNHLFEEKIIDSSTPNYSLILIFKVLKKTHSFTVKKRNGWEYVLHTLYEVTNEEIKAENAAFEASR